MNMSISPTDVACEKFSLAELVPEARRRLVEFGAPLLLTEAEGRLALADQKIRAFERKYGTTLVQLRRSGLPDGASLEMHEDFVEWSGWQRTYEEASQTIASVKPLLERPLAPAPAG
jgi:hypothetical protein